MLKVNKEKFNHFRIARKPQISIEVPGKANGVVLFIDQKERIELFEFIKRIMFETLEFECFSFKFYQSKSKALVFYGCKYDLESQAKEDFERFLEKYIKLKIGKSIFINLVNFKRIYQSSKFDSYKLHSMVMQLIRDEQKIYLPPMVKSARVKVNNELSKYSSIKFKTVGQFGSKRICIYLKPEN